MFEPVTNQLHNKLYKSVLDNLRSLIFFGSNSVSGSNGNNSSFRAKTSAFDDLIRAAAQRHGLDPTLLKAVVQTESNFAATAVSHAGAKGLMQLMDAKARQLGVVNPFDPAENIDAGARFLRQLLNRYAGNEVLALAAYNAGPDAVDRWGGVPPYSETQTYVPRVLGLRAQYREWTA